MKKGILLSLFALLLITAFSYIPSLKNGFTNWDDDKLLTNNVKVRDISWENTKRILTTAHVGLYHPLVLVSYAIEYRFGRYNPLVYHATNFVLHLANTALVFWLVLLFSGSTIAALVTSLLFGIHPIHVASVAWITERKDVLYALFFLGALVSYLYYLKRRYTRYYYLCLFLFILSLLSKAMAVTVPLILLVLDYGQGRKFDKKSLSEKIPFFAVSALFVYITFVARLIGKEPEYTFIDNIFIANFGLLFYIVKTFWPSKLSCYYLPPVKADSLLPYGYLLAPLGVGFVAAIVFFLRKRLPVLIFGGLFFLITILPVLHLISGGPALADHYTYVPLIGIFYIVAEGCRRAIENRKYRAASCATVAAVVAVLSFMTWRQCCIWKDSLTLWNDFFSKNGGTISVPFVYSNRGNARADSGDYNGAIVDFDKAIEIDRRYADAYNNRGTAFLNLGRYDKAAADFAAVLRINPSHSAAWYNIASVFVRKKDYRSAIRDYTEAIRLNPDYWEAYNNLGNALSDSGEVEKSLPCYCAALRLNPQSAVTYNNRGNAYAGIGEFNRAVADYTAALRINPNYAQAYQGRAAAYYNLGMLDKALEDVRSIRRLRVAPDPQLLKALKIGE